MLHENKRNNKIQYFLSFLSWSMTWSFVLGFSVMFSLLSLRDHAFTFEPDSRSIKKVENWFSSCLSPGGPVRVDPSSGHKGPTLDRGEAPRLWPPVRSASHYHFLVFKHRTECRSITPTFYYKLWEQNFAFIRGNNVKTYQHINRKSCAETFVPNISNIGRTANCILWNRKLQVFWSLIQLHYVRLSTCDGGRLQLLLDGLGGWRWLEGEEERSAFLKRRTDIYYVTQRSRYADMKKLTVGGAAGSGGARYWTGLWGP